MRRAVFSITNAFIRQIVVGWFCFVLMADVASAANYSLSYSGRLTQQNGAAVEGPVDIQVSFWNSNTGGAQRGETLTYLSTELNQGVFALNLDLRPDQVKAIFGDGSEAVFVEIAAAGKVYPRQQYLFVPFALRVPTDNTTLAFNDDGKLGFAGASSPTPNSYLSADGSGKLKWVALEAGALSAKTADNLPPSNGQVLTYNGTKWVAAAGGSGTGGSGGSGGTVTSVSGTGPISVATGATTPVISMTQASGSASGYLSYGDWNAFNSKQDAIGYIPLNKAGDTMSGPLSVPLLTQSGTAAPSVAAAGQGSIYFDSGSNQFKVSQNGSAYTPLVTAASVTKVEAGTGLSGGAITTSGTISLANTAVTAGSYTRANITVDQQGRLTAAASSPAIVDADISSSAAIAQSKISGLAIALTGKEASIAAGTSSQYWRGDKSWQTLNTTNVPEGTNQYFTVARAVSSLSGSAPITYSTTTGNIAISKASGSMDGFLSASDWNTFNNKQEALGYAPLNKAGDTMSGALNMNGQPLTAVGNVVINAAKTLGLGVFDSTSEPLMTAQLNSSGAASPDKGKTWFNSSTNQIKYWDGSSAQALGVSGAGLTSLNGQSGSTQSFQVNSSGSAPAINSGSNTHTLSIPNASSSGVTGGVISNADYNSFNGKVAGVTSGTGVSVSTTGNIATVNLATAGTAGSYSKVTTDAYGRVTSGTSLSAADIPPLSAASITSGTLSTSNGGTGISSTATFPSSGVIVTEAAPETLTNKTLTGATINGASSIGGSTSINTSGAITSGALTASNIVSQGNIALQGNGTTSSKLVLNDKGTNYLALKSPDTLVASTTWVLPSTDGSGGQVLATNGSGTLGWASGLAPTGVAGGDLGGSFPNPTVSSVGGVTAANVAAGANLANAATNSNTASTIVKRDASGNFTAGTITANLTGTASTATSAASFTGSLGGDVTGTQGATVVGNVGGVTAANIATGANLANGATNANTASTIVKRDGSGNFTAGTITANLTGNVTGNLTGNASTATSAGSFTGSLGGDVTGTQGATVVGNVGGVTAANVAAGATSANAATNANTVSTIVKRDASGNFAAGTVTANLTGNVTGNLTGNVTGNVSGTAANVTGTVAVANGGTGATTLAANSVLLGNGTSAPLTVAPGASGNVLMSNGTSWASLTPTTNWATPGAIGATTPNSAAFTSLTSSGNVGIGTTAPSALLQVNGVSGFNSGNYPFDTASLWVGDSAYGLNSNGAALRFLNTINNGYGFAFRTQWGGVFADRVVVSGAGNVGIGTTSPGAALDINGFVRVANGNLNVTNGGSVSYLGATNASGNGIMYVQNSAGSNQVYLNSSGASFLNGGNVGIGTTAPTDTLDVVGTVVRSGDRYRFTLPNITTSTWYKLGTWTSTAQGSRAEVTFHAAVGYSASTAANGQTRLFLSTGNQLSAPNITGYFWSEGGSPILTDIRANANASCSGNGTTCMSWDIYGYLNTFAGPDNFYEVKTGSNSTWTQSMTASTPVNTANISQIFSNTHNFSGGNIGIGTTAPAAPLEVNGSMIRSIAHATGNGEDLTDSGQITSRTLTFTKSKAATSVRIAWTDSTRVLSGTTSAACRWEIKVDGASCPGGAMKYDFFMGNATVDHHRAQTLIGYCDGLAAGSHTLTLWVGQIAGQNASSDCYTGWTAIRWVLEAEEVN